MLSDFAGKGGNEREKPPPKPQQRGAERQKIQSSTAENPQALVDPKPAGIKGQRQKYQKKAQGKQQVGGEGEAVPGFAKAAAQIVADAKPHTGQQRPKQRHSLGAGRLDQRNSLWRKLPWVFALSS